MTGIDPLNEEVQALQRLDLAALRDLWRRRWGAPPPLRSRDLLAYATAYRLQAEAQGDLAPPLARRLADLARRFTADRSFRPEGVPLLSPGCSLVREWGGARHEVKVLDQGFSYEGGRFASLSAVARRITGVRWNGPVFFGVKARGGRGA